MWHVYLLECIDGSTYTGIAADVDARYLQHVMGRAAQYTRLHPPRALVAALPIGTRAQACQLEKRIKRWSKARKMDFFQPYTADWRSYRDSDGSDTRLNQLQDPLALHAMATQQIAAAEAEVWAALRQHFPSLAQTILNAGLNESDAARWMCFPIEVLGNAPAHLIARGEANLVLAYVLRVAQGL
jgi:putative endonuclease